MIPVIMSGGSGTRLWPISRKSFPKQFCEIFERSLLEQTLERLSLLNGDASPWVLTTKELEVLTNTSNSTFTNFKMGGAIYEPMPRNTAPAIALACRYFELKGMAEEVMGIFPADHLIEKEDEFISAVRLAEVCAKENQVVTIGIQPNYPATGYGYIETQDKIFKIDNGSNSLQAYHSKRFCEKPDKKTAEQFVNAGNFYWNAGMFVFKVQKMINELKKHMPTLWQDMEKLSSDWSEEQLIDVYKNLEKNSIDYGVMEKLSDLICIPCDIGWSDVGSWEEAAKKISVDKQDIVEIDSKNNFVFQKDKKVYGLVDVDDLLVIDSEDALLIAKNGSSEKVRQVVEQLKENKKNQAEEHNFSHRPWGKYEILKDEDNFKSKKITVLPNQRISYQSHTKRSEHWIIVSGKGEVTLNDEIVPVQSGDHVFIPEEAKHRITAFAQPLVFVEVQLGSYFGEDDITRYQDDYSRVGVIE